MVLANVVVTTYRRELGTTDMTIYEGDNITGVDPTLDLVAARFLSKTNGRLTMRRSEYDPLDFSEQLPDLDIYDFSRRPDLPKGATSLGNATVSFSGSRSAAFYGEYTGKHLVDIEPREVSQRAIKLCKTIKRVKGPIVAVVAPGSPGNEAQHIYLFIMPLTDEAGKINGACVYHILKRSAQSAA